MRKILAGAIGIMLLGLTTGAWADLVWNFTNSNDYWTQNAVLNIATSGGNAYVPPSGTGVNDQASVFSRINTLAPGLKVGDIIGGGYTVTGLNNVGAVYGSLYLSPTGGSGSDVAILFLPPMNWAGSGGNGIYSFDLSTPAEYRTWDNTTGEWTAYDANRSGTFAQVVAMINASSYSGDYAAFFGPQIGMSGTSGTTFTVTEIQLQTVPIPGAVWLLGSALVGLAGARRRFSSRTIKVRLGERANRLVPLHDTLLRLFPVYPGISDRGFFACPLWYCQKCKDCLLSDRSGIYCESILHGKSLSGTNWA